MIKEIIKKTFLYKKYRMFKQQKREQLKAVINDNFKKEAVEVLRRFSDAMFTKNIVFWIDYGTLLGYYREHDFIKHDFDLDTGAWFEDHERIKEVLEKAGFERIRYYFLAKGDGMEECYKHRDYATTIDVFYYFNEGSLSYCYSFNPLVSMNKKRHLNKKQPCFVRKWTFDKITPILSEFKGIRVYVPDNTGSYLASTYGDDFLTPIPNYPLSKRKNMQEYTYDELPASVIMSVGYWMS